MAVVDADALLQLPKTFGTGSTHLPTRPSGPTRWGSNTRQLATSIALAFATCLVGVAKGNASVPLAHILTALPDMGDDKQGPAITFADASGGHTGLLTLELEDEFDAVQVAVINQFETAWGLDRVVAAPSANYGGDPAIGSTAYDLDGQPINQMLPVQWSHHGAKSPPNSANPVLSLTLSEMASGGERSLTFQSTASAPAYGGAQPAVGWFVADGLGCITDGTTVTDRTATSVTLSSPVAMNGCGAGQAVYFSPLQFGPFDHVVPAATSFGNVSLTFSDWLPLSSLPRTDGGFAPGGSVSGAGISGGTSLKAVGYTSLLLSQPLAGNVPARSPISISYTQTTATHTAPQSTQIALEDATSIRAGQSVAGDVAIPPGTHVTSVQGTVVTLDKTTTDDLPDGTRLRFSNTTWTSLPATAGDTGLAVPSTSRRPLLHLRYFTQTGPKITVRGPSCWRNSTLDSLPCEAPLGLPPVWSSIGAQSGGRAIDGVNYVSRIGAGAGSPRSQGSYPSFFVRFLGRHAGATLLICGGFQASGAAGSVSGEAAPGRIGAAWASAQNALVPISTVGIASHQLNTATDFANCNTLTDALRPSMVLIQDYSNHNSTEVEEYRTQVQAVAEHALEANAQPIIYLCYVEATGTVGGVPVAADVNNDTVVPLLTGIGRQVSGSPTLITGPGIPANTTAQSVPGTWQVMLSQKATIPAGSILHFSHRVAFNDGRQVTLTHPSFTDITADLVSAPGIVGDVSLAVAKGAVSATLSSSASLKSGTLLQLSKAPKSSAIHYAEAGQWFYGKTDPWDAVQLDALGVLGTDPNYPTFMCDGCTTGGSYANDYGNSLIAASFVILLQRLTGQTR